MSNKSYREIETEENLAELIFESESLATIKQLKMQVSTYLLDINETINCSIQPLPNDVCIEYYRLSFILPKDVVNYIHSKVF